METGGAGANPDSWAMGHTGIQVIVLCQGCLSKQRTDIFWLWFYLGMLVLGVRLASILLGRHGRSLGMWWFGGREHMAQTQHFICYFTLAKSFEMRRSWNRGLIYLFMTVSFGDSPHLAETLQSVCHRTQPIKLDGNIPDSKLPRLWYSKELSETVYRARLELSGLKAISRNTSVGKYEKTVSL